MQIIHSMPFNHNGIKLEIENTNNIGFRKYVEIKHYSPV